MDKKMIEEKIMDMLMDLCQDEIIYEDPDINLLEEDLIDSLDYVTLLVDVEGEFGLVLSPSEFTREEMSTPRKVVEQITARLVAAAK